MMLARGAAPTLEMHLTLPTTLTVVTSAPMLAQRDDGGQALHRADCIFRSNITACAAGAFWAKRHNGEGMAARTDHVVADREPAAHSDNRINDEGRMARHSWLESGDWLGGRTEVGG